MVIIPTTQTDGHSQPVAITGTGTTPESQDPDEPPIPRPSSSAVEEVKQAVVTTDLLEVATASTSVTDINSKDGWNIEFRGEAETAHLCNSKGVAEFLGVDPTYVG